MLRGRGYLVRDMRADNLVIISKGSTTNFFYLFGGRDERSQDLIQGMTLAGVEAMLTALIQAVMLRDG